MQNKTIKFFISSTFKDFIKERNALQNFVFPRLKKLCQDKGFSFQPVDLRWGVTNESSDDNKTMEYCLNEVKRCSSDPKPNLLILFGQRYGWVPLPSYIESNVFDIIEEKIDNINFTKEEAVKEAQKKLFVKNQTMSAHSVPKLQNWPVQIKLAPVNAPYFNGAKLLIAADCTAYAYAAFHQDFIRNKVTLIGCPKLDQVDYSEKLTAIIQNNNIQSVTIVRMEVPCCGGLEIAAKKALQASGKFIPWQVVTISIDGKIME